MREQEFHSSSIDSQARWDVVWTHCSRNMGLVGKPPFYYWSLRPCMYAIQSILYLHHMRSSIAKIWFQLIALPGLNYPGHVNIIHSIIIQDHSTRAVRTEIPLTSKCVTMLVLMAMSFSYKENISPIFLIALWMCAYKSNENLHNARCSVW